MLVASNSPLVRLPWRAFRQDVAVTKSNTERLLNTPNFLIWSKVAKT
jgi:hypothetical protein